MRAFGMISLLLGVAIVGYLTVLQMGGPKSEGGGGANYKRAEESARKAMETAELQQVATALRTYYTLHQKYPPDLGTLVTDGLISKVPEGLKYNPETGAIEP